MKANLRISIIQFDIVWEYPDKNLTILSSLLRAIDGVTDLVVLPEMFNTGFTLNASPMAESPNGKTVQWMCEQAVDLQAHLIGSLIIEEKGKFHNRLIWVDPEGFKGAYDKRHLITAFGEDKVFSPGKEKLNIRIHDWNIIPFISYDLRFPVWTRMTNGEELMVFIANFPGSSHSEWNTLLKARAIENQCFVVAVNRVGFDGHQQFYFGDSSVIDPVGKILVEAGDKEQIIQYELKYDILERARYDTPFLQDKDSFTLH